MIKMEEDFSRGERGFKVAGAVEWVRMDQTREYNIDTTRNYGLLAMDIRSALTSREDARMEASVHAKSVNRGLVD